MPVFWGAMDDFGSAGKEVREVLAFLEARMYVIAFLDADGGIVGISLVPQQYRCSNCNMLLDMQDDPENHIALCLRQQKKIEINRNLV